MKRILVACFLISSFQTQAQTANGDTTKIYSYVEQMPEFPGGNSAMMKFLSKNLRYPDSARANDIQGRVVLQFIVNTEGKISEVKVLKDIGGGCAEEAIRVVKMMPDWKPGKQNGNYANVYFKLPVTFKLEDKDLTVANVTSPEYPYGPDSLKTFINKNLVYPKDAKKKKIQGTVTLTFEVSPEGKAQNIQVYKKLGFGCDEEAIRILNLIPEWTPGTKDQRAVSFPFYIEVDFKLPAKK